jgi:arylsulfatase A-like enzyme
MNTTIHVQDRLVESPWRIAWRFAWVGATLGLGLGFLEAGLLFFLPRFSGLLRPDVDFVIWFVAPLVDLFTGAFLGLVLGAIGSALSRREPVPSPLVPAFGIGLAAAYLGWLLDWFRIGAGVIFPLHPGSTLLMECFLVGFVAVLLIHRVLRRSAAIHFRREHRPLFRGLAIVNVIALCALSCGLASYTVWRPSPLSTDSAQQDPIVARHDPRPNIILMVLDTVRADHVSCYGYSRHTTPNIDAIATRGTLFENAYAPAPWTLASLASIFTGLLPHQHGANWATPLNAGPWTLARILRSEGYQTAGFSSNSFYGLGAWRLSEGFDTYIDDHYSIRHNLAATFVGESVLQFIYDRLIRYNQFAQRDAADVNRDILRWYRRRDGKRPFFLFVNYMDPHRPYLPPTPYDTRFGKVPHHLLSRLIAPLKGGHPSRPYTGRERQDMIDGYDNSLAYLDSQIGRLLGVIDSKDRHGGTIVIITSDHGEGFGEHGTYDHGWNLYQNVLRVPLVIECPGIPAGLRLSNVVATRQLFSTVLDFTGHRQGSLDQTSLSRFWRSQSQPGSSQDAVVSELVAERSGGRASASVSLVNSEWQYIRDSNGKNELYDLQKDSQEKNNLAAQPDFQRTLNQLKTELKAEIAYSVLPWYGPAYLTPFDERGTALLTEISQKEPGLHRVGTPIGTAQADFSHNAPSAPFRPSRAQQDLLRSLPYH